MLCATCLDPHFKQLRFLPADERVDVYSKIRSIVTENHSSDSESDIEKAKDPASKKMKQDSLLDYHAGVTVLSMCMSLYVH